ncbi:MAG TPA: 2TM domain-containing protein [Dehalococcoidia bacterium]|nr:2TM domain-containing protein [Dehalococcoidia bacterium]
MTSGNQGDKDRGFEGIDIELPFFALRMGRGPWGREMKYEDDEYRRAKRKVRARLGFYRHLATYAAIVGTLMVIDLLAGGGLGFSLWIAGIWGAFVVWQALSTFVFPSLWSREAEERMIEAELRKQRGG